ncbi:hypothetical protein SE17_07385 [Kouleothrix aurantiaca]|uniref:Response regulatory domain-containing protein n=1 Tax=Kouleothrix aurantiaca TaxID=186479 RepID=A0A0P9DUP5_9CHLR|nr:hypothetical protein SE17_07385 [Kouleothrix aurantiaca]
MQHIIIAEDEDDVREFLTRAIQRAAPAAKISAATDGSEALAIVLERGCDLIISDQRMPYMTGVELLNAVREHGYTFPFIIISADVTVEQMLQDAGVSAFFYKPLSMRQIREIVEAWLPPQNAF